MRVLGLVSALFISAPGFAADPMHGGQTFHYAEVELDYARDGGTDLLNWEGQGWIGTDMDKFWVKTEGERSGRELEQAEVQFLYGRNAWQFFDVQAGVRIDAEPDRRGYLVLGVQGLAPYVLDTQAHVFLGEKGDVHLRFRQLFNVLMTNRLIVSPLVETDFYLTDAPERGVGAGFSRIETGVQVRYEVRRKFAPYVAAIYDRKLGETARIAQAAGEDVGGWSVRAGLRLWF
jgi:copper resistance protein B